MNKFQVGWSELNPLESFLLYPKKRRGFFARLVLKIRWMLNRNKGRLVKN